MSSGRKRSTRFNLESDPLVTGRREDDTVERARMARGWRWADRRTRLGVLILVAILALLLLAAVLITALGWWPRLIEGLSEEAAFLAAVPTCSLACAPGVRSRASARTARGA